MTPASSSAPPLPAAGAPRSHRFGLVLVAAAAAHLLAGALFGISLVTGLYGFLIAMGEVKTPTPHGPEQVQAASTTTLVLLVCTAVLLLLGIVLDAIGAVAAVRRLRAAPRVSPSPGPAGPAASAAVPTPVPGRGAPVFHLVVVGMMVALVLVFVLAWALGYVQGDAWRVLTPTSLVLVPLSAVGVPCLRFAQLIVGIVRAARGEPSAPPARR